MPRTLVAQTGLNNPNLLINSNFDFWQRGTSIAAGTALVYVADRWKVGRAGLVTGLTASRQLASLAGSTYCMRIQRNSGDTSTADMFAEQSLESLHSIPTQGQTVAFSFWARAGANYSGGQLLSQFKQGQGTDQTPLTTWTNVATTTGNHTLTTTWQKFFVIVPIAAVTTQLGLIFRYTPSGTAGTNDYVEIAQVMMNVGSAPQAYARAGGNLAGELAMCQRYFEKSYALGDAPGSTTSGVLYLISSGSNEADASYSYKVNKRVGATVNILNTTFLSAVSIQMSSEAGFGLNGTGPGANGNYSFHWTADAEL